MRYFAIYNHDCRFIFLSASTPGTDVDSFIGHHPWEFVLEKEREWIKKQLLKVWEPNCDSHQYGFLWTNPSDPDMKRYYYQHTWWVDCGEVAACARIAEFPLEWSLLSVDECEIMRTLGSGCGVKSAARTHGLNANALHQRIKRIRGKLGLNSIDQVMVLAGLWREALKSEDSGMRHFE